MDIALLETLRCPFCGTRLDLVDNQALARDGSQVLWGVIGCQCCAFPIIDAIPVLIADDATRGAMHTLEAGRRDEALAAMLGLDAAGAARLRQTMDDGSATYKSALELISRDAEATYFVYHFSDPNFVLAETLVRAVGNDRHRMTQVLDLCGGSGHLTRALADMSDRPVVVADVYYWKLWLAQRFTAPGCAPVCCDANSPLPFVDDSFSTVVLADAFPYIWHKRMLADEIVRVAGDRGTIVMPHLHSSLGVNISAGMTLTPAAYHDLFARAQPRLFRDADLLDDVLGHATIDLSRDITPEQAGDDPTVTLVASRDAGVFRAHTVAERGALAGELRVNPLYRVDQQGAHATLTLTFPTPEYEEEFGEARRYLPDTLTLDADLRGRLEPAQFGAAYADLRRRRILLDAPKRYY